MSKLKYDGEKLLKRLLFRFLPPSNRVGRSGPRTGTVAILRIFPELENIKGFGVRKK
jgi:hypothetical protein